TALPAGSMDVQRASAPRHWSAQARTQRVRPRFTPPTPTLLPPFDGPDEVSAGGFLPPDDNMAAGPNHVVVAVNLVLQAYTKTGAPAGGLQILDTATGHFFGGLGLSGDGTSDPRVAY